MKPYAIASPYPDKNSAGISALHKLSDDLNASGLRSRVLYLTGYERLAPDEILVLPDTIFGNPLRAKNVVRYLLMEAGYFGHDKTFPESEFMYYHSPDFVLNGRNPDNILTVPVTDETRFPYRKGGRSGTCYLARKYKNAFRCSPPDVEPDWIEITHETDLDRLFRTVKTLVTYDNSAITLEAAICGVDVVYKFNDAFTRPISLGADFDWLDTLSSYERLKMKYKLHQLPEFIGRTQARFS